MRVVHFNLPDSTLMMNTSRALYTVNTVNPHRLRVGDIVEFENSEFEKVNGRHVVAQAGYVQLATGYVRITTTGERSMM